MKIRGGLKNNEDLKGDSGRESTWGRGQGNWNYRNMKNYMIKEWNYIKIL